MRRRRTFIPKPTTQPPIHSENRISVPHSFFTTYPTPSSSTLPVTKKKPIVGKMLRNFEYEMKKWLTSLTESCSESYNPVEAHQLFSKFRKKFSTTIASIQDVCCKNALKNLFRKIKTRVLYLKDVPESEDYTSFAVRCVAAKAAEKAILNVDLLKAERKIEEFSRTAAAAREQVSGSPTTMEIVEEQISVAEENVVVVGEEVKTAQPEDSVDMKAWMANQERVTSELQKTTEDLQKSNAELKSWMVQQGETSSKIENLLTQLLAKQS